MRPILIPLLYASVFVAGWQVPKVIFCLADWLDVLAGACGVLVAVWCAFKLSD